MNLKSILEKIQYIVQNSSKVIFFPEITCVFLCDSRKKTFAINLLTFFPFCKFYKNYKQNNTNPFLLNPKKLPKKTLLMHAKSEECLRESRKCVNIEGDVWLEVRGARTSGHSMKTSANVQRA